VAASNLLAALSASLSDAAAMRYPAVVTSTGPRRTFLSGALASDEALPPELVFDASSPECGIFGGEPRSQLGGGPGTADLCASQVTALACSTARASLVGGAPDANAHAVGVPLGLQHLLAQAAAGREALTELGATHVTLSSSASVAESVAFAGRIARIEAAGAPINALGRRRRVHARGRHIVCSAELMAQLLTATQFGKAQPV
jgi:hypothetical protein